MNKIIWPGGKSFAFTIVDDTDKTTLENGPVVYDFLNDLGIKITKTVWIFNGEERSDNLEIIGETCENKRYREWTKSLQKNGFEIALHNMSWSKSKRERVIAGMELFNDYFGNYPKLLAQHNDTDESESLYWGRHRLSFPTNLLFDLLSLFNPKSKKSEIYQGEVESSQFFWGDICKEKIKYTRNFIFSNIDTLEVCPVMPYHDSSKPYVNKWFASTEAPDATSFNTLLSKKNLDLLEKRGGCCIVYTHFGKDFVNKGILNEEFVQKMSGLAKRNGWFAPASDVLDHIEKFKSKSDISKLSRFLLEINWLYHKVVIGGTS